MHGAAPHFASQLSGLSNRVDLIIASDFLDLASFLGLSRMHIGSTPSAIYFHENQLAYPWSPKDPDRALQRDRHYAFINLTSALAADSVIFSTHFQKDSFLDALPAYLNAYPDFRLEGSRASINNKSVVISPGLELPQSLPSIEIAKLNSTEHSPIIVWNHRWEFDKGPELFFRALYSLQEQNIAFRLVVLGKAYGKAPPIFDEAKSRLHHHILHWGYCASREEYFYWLGQSDIAAITSYQDFFGMSVIEAAWMGCTPLLPRRLAYPEIFGELAEWYDTDGAFINRLRQLIVNFIPAPYSLSLREKLKKHLWENCIREYDTHFDSMVYS
jgi:glycosyltransferase involved in cell wall biosynthesis